MRHIKRGRGPAWMNALGGILGLVVLVGMCSQMSNIGNPTFPGGSPFAGAPSGIPNFFFMVIGVMFIVIIANVCYSIYNATAENRTSEYDITDSNEEPDPLDPSHRGQVHLASREDQPSTTGRLFCPHCGARVGEDFKFCPKCGKEI